MRMSFFARQSLVIFLQVFLVIILLNLQTIAWPLIFGSMLAPLFWLNVVLYLALYRKPTESILLIYFIGYIVSFFSVTSLKMSLLPLLAVFLTIQFVKNRIFWSGFGYFIMMSCFGTFVYHSSFFILSRYFEPLPAQVQFFTRFAQIFLTPSVSLPVYLVLSKIDLILESSILRASAEEVSP